MDFGRFYRQSHFAKLCLSFHPAFCGSLVNYNCKFLPDLNVTSWGTRVLNHLSVKFGLQYGLSDQLWDMLGLNLDNASITTSTFSLPSLALSSGAKSTAMISGRFEALRIAHKCCCSWLDNFGDNFGDGPMT